MSRPSRQSGLTIAELMVVVAIVGVLAGLAATTLRSNKAGAAAREAANFLAEARREAVQGGTLRPDVVAAATADICPGTLATNGFKDGMRVFIQLQDDPTTCPGASCHRVLYLYKAIENAYPSTIVTWRGVLAHHFSPDVDVTWVGAVDLEDPPNDTVAAGAVPTARCYSPVGTLIRPAPSNAVEPFTIYVKERADIGAPMKERYRVVMLPGAAEPLLLSRW